MKAASPCLTMLFCLILSRMAAAQTESSTVRIIRFDANGAGRVQQQSQAVSVLRPSGAVLSTSSALVNSRGEAVASRETTTATTQPSADVSRSETTTQVRDKNGVVRQQTKTIMTETRVSSDTVKTETLFQESRPNATDLVTAARMKETRRETASGEEYRRVLETRTSSGEFRPKQTVEAVTQKFSDGTTRTRSLESEMDWNGNTRPVRQTIETRAGGPDGRETIERIIERAEANGTLKLERVEREENNPRATSGVIKDKVIKQPEPYAGLREVQRVTTTMENPAGGAPYKLTVTRELSRNDRTRSIITQVEIERTRRRWDGTTYVERELKVRDVNGDLATVSITQIEHKESKPAFAASVPIRTAQ